MRGVNQSGMSPRTFAMGADDGQMQRAYLDPQGNVVNLGESYDPRNPYLDTGMEFVNPNAPDSTVTKKPRERAFETRAGAIEGESATTARIDLPKVEDAATELLGLTEELLSHRGKSMALGKSGLIPAIPGTDYADFMTRYKQISGKQFMQAYQTLKGGGQITEIEGEQARDALARMSRAQTEDEFNRSVRDFQDVVKKGLARARGEAGVAETPSSVDDLVNKYAN